MTTQQQKDNSYAYLSSSADLVSYLLHLGDSTLILAQQNAKWCGHGPVLEQDIALTNISLDLLGQARNYLQYAALILNSAKSSDTNLSGRQLVSSSASQLPTVDEDTLAYQRDVLQYKNLLLTEQPNGDWAHTILRQFFFSSFQFDLLTQLQQSKDEQIAAIAVKSGKEVSYHLRWSSEWVVRLGDGTDESRARILAAIESLWPFTGEMFMPADYEMKMADLSIGVNPAGLRNAWDARLKTVFEEAHLAIPPDTWYQHGGKQGNHSEHLGYILAELQFMQRAYPGNEW